MRNYSNSPTKENIINMFMADAAGRNKEIVQFVNLIESIEGGCTIAINGEWGSGKTFFVQQSKLVMDYMNASSDMDAETREKVKLALGNLSISCSESYATVYYDAWENDNDEDPILSLIYATIQNNQVDIRPDNSRSIYEILASIAEVVTGRNLSNLLEKARGADLFETIKQTDNLNELVGDFLNALIEERGNQLIFFIDELDRCKPTYTIKLLERIKHYFDDDRVIFVFSVNLFQLQHTIKCYYGADFDATRYLDKFFDLRVSLPEIDYDNYLLQRFRFIKSSYLYDKTCIQVIKYFKFSLRETERYIRLIKIAAYKHAHSSNGGGFSEERGFHFAMLYIIPVLLGLSMTDLHLYKQFTTGQNCEPLCKILLSPDGGLRKDWMLSSNESFSDEEANEKKLVVSIEQKIKDVYDALFSAKLHGSNREIYIGQMEFSLNTRNKINEMVSLLSQISDYKFE